MTAPVRLPRPWPFPPLWAAAGYPSISQVCRRVRASGSTVEMVAEHGLTDAQADRWAVRLGVMPGDVWVGWYEAGLLAADEWLLMGATA